MLKGFSEINKKMLCLSRESVERVSVGTGSGELQRPIYFQPLGGQIGAGTGERQARCLGHRISGDSSSRGASSESSPNSEGFLTLHMLGATLVRVSTGSEAEAMGADSGSITA